MSSSSFKKVALTGLPGLVTTFFLVGCSPTLMTPTVAIETDKIIAAGVCEEWKSITYSSRDTAETQTEARANNAARDGYCG